MSFPSDTSVEKEAQPPLAKRQILFSRFPAPHNHEEHCKLVSWHVRNGRSRLVLAKERQLLHYAFAFTLHRPSLRIHRCCPSRSSLALQIPAPRFALLFVAVVVLLLTMRVTVPHPPATCTSPPHAHAWSAGPVLRFGLNGKSTDGQAHKIRRQ